MAKSKYTKADYFKALLNVKEVADNPNLVAFINHELELLAKKNTAKSDKQSAKQIENNALRDKIVAEMVAGEKYSIPQIIKSFECVSGIENITSQRVSALLSPMVYDKEKNADGKIVKTYEKRVAYFSLR